MKQLLFVPIVLGVVAGCNSPRPAEEQAASASSDKTTALGRSMDKGEGIATDSNIAQINAMVPRDENGKPPATLEELRKSLKDYPAEMWVDGATGKPLSYDPATGTVARSK